MAKRTVKRTSNRTILTFIFFSGILIGIGLTFLAQWIAIPSNLYYSVITEPNFTAPRVAALGVAAISAETGEGLIGSVIIEMMPGKGRVLISTNPFIEPDTQDSVHIAKSVAEKATGTTLSNYDIVASFDLPKSESGVVGGPSAGLPITLAIIAAANNVTLNDIAATGTIDANGTIGPIGGIVEKAEAAGKAGKKMFLLPKGQGVVTYYERDVKTEQIGSFTVQRISYIPRKFTLSEFTKQWNMTTLEVETIWEATKAVMPDVQLTAHSPLSLEGS
jgi:uncharacterized protein